MYEGRGEVWKEPLGTPRHRWEDKIKMDVQEAGLGGKDLIYLVQDRDKWQALIMNLWVL
jgi:hypothetical protein